MPRSRSTALALLGAAALVTGALGVAHAAPPTTLEGVVHTLAADTVDHQARPNAFVGNSEDVYRQVLVANGKSYVLHGAKARNNTRVRVSGSLVGKDFTATSLSTLGTVAGLTDTGTTRVLVMLAYWTAPDSVTQAGAAAQMFTDTNGWYRDASYGALGQTGDVTPWMPIAGPTTGCYADFTTLMDEARSAASARGYNLANYDNFVLYFPYCAGDSAGYAGWAWIGAPGVWLNGYMDRRSSVHEQGHNYGLYHSHSQMCSAGGMAGTCTFSDYGDMYDAMGSSSYVGHFNASQKNILGWLGGRTIDLSAGGTTTLAPMAADAVSPHAAFAIGSSRTYWLEYRQPIDFDSWLPAADTDGVLVHVSGAGSGSPDPGASIIDVRPSDGIEPWTSSLRAGQSWTSPEGITFTVGSVTTSGATVTVSRPSSARVEEPAATYDGWQVFSDPTANGGTWRTSATSGNTAAFGFTGSSVTWVSHKGPHQGKATVTIDGVAKGTVDLYSATTAAYSVTYSGLSTAAHTITVKVTGTKNAASTGAGVVVDAFAVGTTTTQESAAKVTYEKWKSGSSVNASGGAYRSSGTANATASYKFTGTGVDWVTTTGPGWGKAEVYVDGVDKGTVDLYASAAHWQTVKTYGGLAAGSHTIKIKVLGAKNALAKATTVAVDAFVVHP